MPPRTLLIAALMNLLAITVGVLLMLLAERRGGPRLPARLTAFAFIGVGLLGVIAGVLLTFAGTPLSAHE
ncbi:MAG: hypothetical protein RLY93_12365 [Sumerlaeia bacterium]